MKKTVLGAFFASLFFFLFTGAAFAQDNNVAAISTVPAADLTAPAYDWQKDSKIYKGIGWGFFGGGIALGIAGPIIALSTSMSSMVEGDVEGISGGAIAGYAVAGLGSAMFTTGVILLIVEAVKFGPYRRGEIAGVEFDWRPEVYASPEFSGFGLSARF